MQNQPLPSPALATLLHPPGNHVTSESLNFFLGVYFFIRKKKKKKKEAVAEGVSKMMQVKTNSEDFLEEVAQRLAERSGLACEETGTCL